MLTDELIRKLQMRYPGITIFVHKQVMEGVNRIPSIYAHPDVADYDIGFSRQGETERIFVRCVNRHRLFDYRVDTMSDDAWRRELFLRFVVDSLPGLFGPATYADNAAGTDVQETDPEDFESGDDEQQD